MAEKLHFKFMRWVEPRGRVPSPPEGYGRAEVRVLENHQHHKGPYEVVEGHFKRKVDGDVIIIDIPLSVVK